jgi:glycosyltransferase involved in cell wall biosynthesis
VAGAADVVALAWVRFQPRTQALADDLGGMALFVDPGRRGASRARSILRHLNAALRTWRLLDQHRPAGVVTLPAPVLAPLVAWAWCTLRRRPLLIDCQPEDDIESGAVAGLGPVQRFLLRRARAVLTHTPTDLVLVDRWRSHGVLLIDDLPQPVPAPAGRRRGLGSPDVAVAACLHPDEPYPVLLEAARLLPDVTFALTGDPARLPWEVLTWLPPNVSLAGIPPRPQLLDLFARAQVVAVLGCPADPSVPRPAFEAVGLGRPVVLLDRPGVRATFGQAALVTPALPTSMARAIRYGLEDGEEAAARTRALGTQLRERRAHALGRLRHLLQRDILPPPPRILILSQILAGNHWVLRRNVWELLERGFDVDLVCLGRPEAEDDVPLGAGRLRVLAVPVRRARGTLGSWAGQAAFVVIALVLTAVLGLRRRYVAVQVDNRPDLLVLAALLPRLRGARVVLNMLDLTPELVAASLPGRLGRAAVAAARLVEALAGRCADRLMVSSQACEERLLARGFNPASVTVIVNSMPAAPAGPAETESPGAGPEPGPGEGYLVACAPLEARSGTHLVVEAMAMLQGSWPRLRLRISGDGPELSALVQQVCLLGLPSHVSLAGGLSWERLVAEVRGARLGVLALLRDGYSELLLPAELFLYARLEVPVVCPRLPAVVDCFPPDSIAYFEPGDGRGLAREINRLLRDPARARAQAGRAREVAARYDWERVAERYVVQELGLSSATRNLSDAPAEPEFSGLARGGAPLGDRR